MTLLRPPALDPATLAGGSGKGHAEPFRARVAGRHRRALGDGVGLGDFGIEMTRPEPGAAPARRDGTPC